jgi:hypothetical protein
VTTFGSTAKIKWDKPKDRLNPAQLEKDLTDILEQIVEIRRAWEQVVDGGSYSPRTENGRPSTHAVTDPTAHAVFTPTQKQLRQAGRQAAELIGEAKDHLALAADVLHRSLFRSDPEVLARFLEKRNAATQR